MPAATPKHKVDAGQEKVSNNEQALMKYVKQDQYCSVWHADPEHATGCGMF